MSADCIFAWIVRNTGLMHLCTKRRYWKTDESDGEAALNRSREVVH